MYSGDSAALNLPVTYWAKMLGLFKKKERERIESRGQGGLTFKVINTPLNFHPHSDTQIFAFIAFGR